MFLGLKNLDGVKEEVKKINKALGEGSKYGCEDYYGKGYWLKKK